MSLATVLLAQTFAELSGRHNAVSGANLIPLRSQKADHGASLSPINTGLSASLYAICDNL